MRPTYSHDLEKAKEILGYKQTHTDIPEDFIEFNKFIGLPKHPATLKEQPLTAVQRGFFKEYVHPTRQCKIHLNKARQCGWTEMILRILAYHCFHKYAGGKIVIIPGTRERTTKEIFGRFKELIKNTGKIEEEGYLYIRLSNGTEIYGEKANPEAITGWTKIKAILMDEAAKWNLVDDTPVINAILPIVRTNKSDLFMISTPKGPRGFFYNIDMNPQSDFLKVKYDIHAAGAELYSDEERQKMIESSEEDPAQEYLNQYTTGRNSIFGNNFKEEDYEASWA